MTDDALISTIRNELTFVAARGFPTLACNVGELAKRFENLAKCHALLAEREERLTRRIVELER